MKPNIPAWRIWLVTLLAALWGIFAITTARQEQWSVFALCLVLFLWNVYQLWLFTRKPKS